MPIDPMTGMPKPYTQDEMLETPLYARTLENLPGITAGIGFQAGRGARTIMAGGGFMDDASRFGVDKKAQRYGAFRRGAMSLDPNDLSSGQQFLSFGRKGKRGARLAGEAGRQPIYYGARVNTLTARPRALRRMSSLSAFAEDQRTYTYAQGIRGPLSKARFGPLGKLAEASGTMKDEALLGPGLFAGVTAGRKMDLLERRAYDGNARALSKLEGSTTGIQRMAGMNTKLTAGTPIVNLNPLEAFPESYAVPDAFGPSSLDRSMGSAVAGKGVGEIGTRGNLLASSMAGKGTRYMAGYFRGAQGFADVAGLHGQAYTGAQKAIANMASALGTEGIVGKAGEKLAGETAAKQILKEGAFKTLGAKGTMEAFSTKAGMKVLGARGAAMAIPGLNLLATASLVYDIGKMGGEVIKSGINLARDAEKSLQGSFSKPMFGMGYRDTEAAATSRSRGVMAIQNSRLNARSALGSEASMMAAHFG
jgi:hypothetical protein